MSCFVHCFSEVITVILSLSNGIYIQFHTPLPKCNSNPCSDFEQMFMTKNPSKFYESKDPFLAEVRYHSVFGFIVSKCCQSDCPGNNCEPNKGRDRLIVFNELYQLHQGTLKVTTVLNPTIIWVCKNMRVGSNFYGQQYYSFFSSMLKLILTQQLERQYCFVVVP